MENRNIKNFIKTNAIWLVFIIEVLIFSVASKGTFISASNMVNIMRQMS